MPFLIMQNVIYGMSSALTTAQAVGSYRVLIQNKSTFWVKTRGIALNTAVEFVVVKVRTLKRFLLSVQTWFFGLPGILCEIKWMVKQAGLQGFNL